MKDNRKFNFFFYQNIDNLTTYAIRIIRIKIEEVKCIMTNVMIIVNINLI